jgi:hypothetical protein
MFIIQNVEYTLHKQYFRNFVSVKGTIWRKPTMRAPALYYYGLAAFCVVSLFVGMAHAADPAPAALNTTTIHGFGYGHSPMPRLNLSCLEQQGVTIMDVKAALDRNDTASVRKWSDACSQSLKEITGNATHRQQQKSGTGAALAEWNGTKVHTVRNLSMHSNLTGMTFGSFGGNVTHKFPVANLTLFRPGSPQNGTIMHHILNGSDAGRKKIIHPNGNTTAIKPLPDQNRRSYPSEIPKGPRSGSSSAVNSTPPRP